MDGRIGRPSIPRPPRPGEPPGVPSREPGSTGATTTGCPGRIPRRRGFPFPFGREGPAAAPNGPLPEVPPGRRPATDAVGAGRDGPRWQQKECACFAGRESGDGSASPVLQRTDAGDKKFQQFQAAPKATPVYRLTLAPCSWIAFQTVQGRFRTTHSDLAQDSWLDGRLPTGDTTNAAGDTCPAACTQRP